MQRLDELLPELLPEVLPDGVVKMTAPDLGRGTGWFVVQVAAAGADDDAAT